ncbi:hypothetical protein NCCP2716_29630 [Sporosarcina sp. NCCP-2716]|uniref:DUF3006 domain-containing protein n=1 Tax=Sporosarcina sp. NCCP-2716 TaxID=2943679 RepID=UPI00208A4567|nr:DUF3006 domain-containing protein [Sporosarcina sp. NCCP-2716]GKV70465.1 hypothetical protein NCCP2716_29630 [Sporosarcina sp. NCCP-2716]
MTVYTIDRFEGDVAVMLERGNETVQRDIPVAELPSTVEQGDILDIEFDEDGTVRKAVTLTEQTLAAKQRAEALLQKLLDQNK